MGQGYTDIFVIDLGIEKASDYIQMIDDAAMSSDQRDEIYKCIENSDRGTSYSEVRLFIVFNC